MAVSRRGGNRRLANVKTRTETGFEYCLGKLEIQTGFGKKAQKEARPFYPGEEAELIRELDLVEAMTCFVREHARALQRLDEEVFMCMKDISGTLERSRQNTLTEVEIFEVKSLLLNFLDTRNILAAAPEVPQEFIPEAQDELLDRLDPRGDRTNTFYLYDEFSERLKELRRAKRQLETDLRRSMKARRDLVLKQYGIALTPKFDIVIPRSSDDLAKAKAVPELEQVAEDYMAVTFALTRSEEQHALARQAEELETEIEEEETRVREMLSREIAGQADATLANCVRIGRLEYVLAKARFAVARNCTRPEITEEHVVEIEEGRQLQAEDMLRTRGKEYCPISISLRDGVTCITGANMGGKTVSLKLSGLVPMLAQYGFFVPCKRARVGLSNFCQILIGDSQSLERGLSSFGSEMEELKEILDNADDRSLILIDEIASGTNPVEGLALTKSLVDYFLQKPYITLITTHFETVTEEEGVRNMQVRGLAGADFRKLNSELHYANRRERINVIAKYMDYRLELVSGDREVPKDALNIAHMLGISDEIIEGAKRYLK